MAQEPASSILRRLVGAASINLRSEWLAAVEASAATTAASLRCSREDALLSLLLCSDLRDAAAGSLPAHVDSMHDTHVQGVHFLQIEQVANIGEPSDNRFNNSQQRMLKISLTDGASTVIAVEFERWSMIDTDIAPGCKVLVKNPYIRRGLMLLSNANIRVLGGMVESLVQAENRSRAAVLRQRGVIVKDEDLSGTGAADGTELPRERAEQAAHSAMPATQRAVESAPMASVRADPVSSVMRATVSSLAQSGVSSWSAPVAPPQEEPYGGLRVLRPHGASPLGKSSASTSSLVGLSRPRTESLPFAHHEDAATTPHPLEPSNGTFDVEPVPDELELERDLLSIDIEYDSPRASPVAPAASSSSTSARRSPDPSDSPPLQGLHALRSLASSDTGQTGLVFLTLRQALKPGVFVSDGKLQLFALADDGASVELVAFAPDLLQALCEFPPAVLERYTADLAEPEVKELVRSKLLRLANLMSAYRGLARVQRHDTCAAPTAPAPLPAMSAKLTVLRLEPNTSDTARSAWKIVQNASPSARRTEAAALIVPGE